MNKRLRRSTTERMIGGVAGGLGEFFDLDPTVVRLVFAILVLSGGSGLILYPVLWALIPDEQGRRTVVPVAIILLFFGVSVCCGLTGAMLAVSGEAF